MQTGSPTRAKDSFKQRCHDEGQLPRMVKVADFSHDAPDCVRETNESLFMARCNSVQKASSRFAAHLPLAKKFLGDNDPGKIIGYNKAYSIAQPLMKSQEEQICCHHCLKMVPMIHYIEHLQLAHPNASMSVNCPKCQTSFAQVGKNICSIP